MNTKTNALAAFSTTPSHALVVSTGAVSFNNTSAPVVDGESTGPP